MRSLPDSVFETDSTRAAFHGRSCNAGPAFARLSIGSASYEVADALSETAHLAFRATGGHIWTAPDRTIADGWIKIAADIVLIDPDSRYQFLHTHAVRQSQDEPSGAALEFLTLGTSWQVVLQDNGSAEVRFANEAPVMVNLGPKAPAGRRERAILSLLDAKRDAPDLFGAEFAQWAHRIATGVSIAPVM